MFRRTISFIVLTAFLLTNINFGFARDYINLAPPLLLDDIADGTPHKKNIGLVLAEISLQMDLKKININDRIDNTTDAKLIKREFLRDQRAYGETTDRKAGIIACFDQLRNVAEDSRSHIFYVPVIILRGSNRYDYRLIFSTIRNKDGFFPITYCTKEKFEEIKSAIAAQDRLPQITKSDRDDIDRFVRHEEYDKFLDTAHEKGWIVDPGELGLKIEDIVDWVRWAALAGSGNSENPQLKKPQDREFFVVEITPEREKILEKNKLILRDEKGNIKEVIGWAHPSNRAWHILLTTSQIHDLKDGLREGAGCIKYRRVIEEIRLHMAHDYGVMCGLPILRFEGNRPINEMDERYRRGQEDITSGKHGTQVALAKALFGLEDWFTGIEGYKCYPLADLDTNLRVRDYASSDERIVEEIARLARENRPEWMAEFIFNHEGGARYLGVIIKTWENNRPALYRFIEILMSYFNDKKVEPKDPRLRLELQSELAIAQLSGSGLEAFMYGPSEMVVIDKKPFIQHKALYNELVQVAAIIKSSLLSGGTPGINKNIQRRDFKYVTPSVWVYPYGELWTVLVKIDGKLTPALILFRGGKLFKTGMILKEPQQYYGFIGQSARRMEKEKGYADKYALPLLRKLLADHDKREAASLTNVVLEVKEALNDQNSLSRQGRIEETIRILAKYGRSELIGCLLDLLYLVTEDSTEKIYAAMDFLHEVSSGGEEENILCMAFGIPSPSKSTVRRDPKTGRATEHPGKSSQDAKIIIALYLADRDSFTVRDYLNMYKPHYAEFGFEAPAEDDNSAMQTARRDLDGLKDERVLFRFDLEKDGYRYYLTSVGSEMIKQVKTKLFVSKKLTALRSDQVNVMEAVKRDAKMIIARHLLDRRIFSADEYNEICRSHWEELGLPGPIVDEESTSLASRLGLLQLIKDGILEPLRVLGSNNEALFRISNNGMEELIVLENHRNGKLTQAFKIAAKNNTVGLWIADLMNELAKGRNIITRDGLSITFNEGAGTTSGDEAQSLDTLNNLLELATLDELTEAAAHIDKYIKVSPLRHPDQGRSRRDVLEQVCKTVLLVKIDDLCREVVAQRLTEAAESVMLENSRDLEALTQVLRSAHVIRGPDGRFLPHPGKSPEDALKTIMYDPSLTSYPFTLNGYHDAYVKCAEFFGFEKPAENWERTFRKDLDELCAMGILTKKTTGKEHTYAVAFDNRTLGQKEETYRALKAKAEKGDGAAMEAIGLAYKSLSDELQEGSYKLLVEKALKCEASAFIGLAHACNAMPFDKRNNVYDLIIAEAWRSKDPAAILALSLMRGSLTPAQEQCVSAIMKEVPVRHQDSKPAQEAHNGSIMPRDVSPAFVQKLNGHINRIKPEAPVTTEEMIYLLEMDGAIRVERIGKSDGNIYLSDLEEPVSLFTFMACTALILHDMGMLKPRAEAHKEAERQAPQEKEAQAVSTQEVRAPAVADTIAILPAEFIENGMDVGDLAGEFSSILGSGLSTDKSTFIFSEKVTFDNGLGVLLPKLVSAGTKVVVIATTDRQRALIADLNKTLVGTAENVVCADNVADARARVPSARYYYFKVTGDPDANVNNIMTFDITNIVERIIQALGKVCGIVEPEKIEQLKSAARAFAIAA